MEEDDTTTDKRMRDEGNSWHCLLCTPIIKKRNKQQGFQFDRQNKISTNSRELFFLGLTPRSRRAKRPWVRPSNRQGFFFQRKKNAKSRNKKRNKLPEQRKTRAQYVVASLS